MLYNCVIFNIIKSKFIVLFLVHFKFSLNINFISYCISGKEEKKCISHEIYAWVWVNSKGLLNFYPPKMIRMSYAPLFITSLL